MTLALNKSILIILLIILLFLVGISGVYGGYSLILGQAGNQFSTGFNANLSALFLGFLVVLTLGVLPISVALRLLTKHKKRVHA
jgi:hypothetical protein